MAAAVVFLFRQKHILLDLFPFSPGKLVTASIGTLKSSSYSFLIYSPFEERQLHRNLFNSAHVSWLFLLRKLCPSLTSTDNERPPAADLLEVAIGNAQAPADHVIDDTGKQVHERPRQSQQMLVLGGVSHRVKEFPASERLVVVHVINARGDGRTQSDDQGRGSILDPELREVGFFCPW